MIQIDKKKALPPSSKEIRIIALFYSKWPSDHSINIGFTKNYMLLSSPNEREQGKEEHFQLFTNA
jgi:hypothetical protein